jgi:hypothetical protein
MLVYRFDNAPCPFCGGVDIAMKTIYNTDNNTWKAYCECQHCAARGSCFSCLDTEEEAIEDAGSNWRESCTISKFDKYVAYPLHRLYVSIEHIIHEGWDEI